MSMPRQVAREMSRWLPLGLALVLAAGCAAGTSASPRASSPSAKPTAVLPAAWQGVFGPLDAYLYSGSDPVRLEASVRAAAERKSAGCMQAKGWQYEATIAASDQVRRDLLTAGLTSAIADDGYRKQFGYGVSAGLRSTGPKDELNGPNARYYNRLSMQQQAQYDKDFPTCAGEANRRVGLDTPAWQEFGKIKEDVTQRISAADEVVNGQQAWQDCMVKAGYTVSSPSGASELLDRRAQPLYARGASESDPAVQALVRDELRQAETDWQCRLTYLLPPYQQVRDRLEREALEQHLELVQSVRDSLARAGGA